LIFNPNQYKDKNIYYLSLKFNISDDPRQDLNYMLRRLIRVDPTKVNIRIKIIIIIVLKSNPIIEVYLGQRLVMS
jgi:hypothetical protein